MAALLGIGRTLLHELDSTGRIPAPMKLGNRCVWSVTELRTGWLRDALTASAWDVLKVSDRK